ncbi:MAG: phosphoenolpyruvate--protein phosphotransferase, partial [Mycobacterium sp.]|nr:phosphoenolpyruvate--protein phosphotransferase [Mycobacterium sp.]
MSTTTSSTSLPPAGTVLQGIPAVGGVQYAPVIRPGTRPGADDGSGAADLGEADRPSEVARFTAAAAAVANRLRDRAANASGAASEVLATTAQLAQDRAWIAATEKRIGDGNPAVRAVTGAVDQFVTMFTQLGGLMAERVTDLRDIRDRVIAELSGLPEPGVPVPEVPSILCAGDLAPVDTAGLDASLVVALATTLGGPTSHTAIIARQLGIPCVVGVSGLSAVRGGTRLLVDGTTGEITLEPDAQEAARLVAEAQAAREALDRWTGPGRTADGTPVKLLANVADGASATSAAAGPVEGVGLFRTELCFLNQTTEPSVEEQADIYATVLSAFRGRYVVVRTLDAGSDKPVAFATHEGEENPALGVRGLRLSFDNPGLLERQL